MESEGHEAEGVIRFRPDHLHQPLADPSLDEPARILASWRQVARALGVVGCDPGRYGGAGFGNISLRVGRASAPTGARPFLITGTQTGARETLGPESLALVTRYAIGENRVESRGDVLPSSEAMTHAAVYDADPDAGMVIHGHAPALWRRAVELDALATAPDVPYGTPDMAAEVARALRRAGQAYPRGWRRRVVAMLGHEDGILAVGRDADEAGAALVAAVAEAWR